MLSRVITIVVFCVIALFAFIPVYADTTAPVSTFNIDPAIPNGENDWYVSYPNISISAVDDDTGVSAINYKINDEDWERYTFTQGLNVVQNPSFEYGYIDQWDFEHPLLAVGFKSSLFHRTGNYSASIIALSPFFDSYWITEGYFNPLPLQTYYFSFYMKSITSWVDNGWYEIISVSPTSGETVLASQDWINLKWNFKEYSGVFTTTADTDAVVYMKIGLHQLGHLNVDDVSISTAGAEPNVNFVLNREGVNTIQYYSEDAVGNIENTRSAEIKVDTVSPNFSGFEAFNQESIQKFASRVNVADSTSGLVDDPSLFNYAVDGFTNGFYDDYANCAGNFNQDLFINLGTDFSYGANSGQVSTTVIDYCDSNWVNCKRLNYYVKDIAGNIGSHSICVNGPYINSNYGNVFGRVGMYTMGLGDNHNIWGPGVSEGEIVDVSSFTDVFVSYYNDHPYLNDAYTYYTGRIGGLSTTVSDITTDSGIYNIDDNYTVSGDINYPDDVEQIYFINGGLTINGNVYAGNNNSIYYLVNGDITISTETTQVDANLISTNQIFTASDAELADRLTVNGVMAAQNLVFNRNTDRTLGASEIINFPLYTLFDQTPLYRSNVYWREVLE